VTEDPFDVVALLERCAAEIDVSAADRITDDVVAALPAGHRRRSRRPLAVAAAVLVALIVAGVVASASTRHAVARLFGVAGVEISTAPDLPLATTARLDLGTPVPEAEVPGRTGFTPVRLDDARLGPPAGPYVRDSSVSFVYAPGRGVPESSTPGVGVILTQLRADVEQPLLQKVLGPGSVLTPVNVHGVPGYWIGGEGHDVVFLGRGNDVVDEPIRLAQHVLLWERDGITYRLEGAFDLQTALELAASLH
jgi:hypothetical protein